MEDSAMTMVAFFISAIIMFIFPLMSISSQEDKVSKLTVEQTTINFTNTIRTTGKLTQSEYSSFTSTLASSGNIYDVEITVQVLDSNPARVETSKDKNNIGKNVYYVLYTTQILEQLEKNGSIAFKENDIVSVSVSRTNTTIAEQLRNFVYVVTDNTSDTTLAESSGFITATGI